MIAGRKLPADPRSVTAIRNRAGATLRKMKAKGWVEEVDCAGD